MALEVGPDRGFSITNDKLIYGDTGRIFRVGLHEEVAQLEILQCETLNVL